MRAGQCGLIQELMDAMGRDMAADITWKYMSMPSPCFSARCPSVKLGSGCQTYDYDYDGLSSCAGKDSEGKGINLTAFTQFMHFSAMRLASKAHKMDRLANSGMVCVHLYTHM
jgi:hypothetical protein